MCRTTCSGVDVFGEVFSLRPIRSPLWTVTAYDREGGGELWIPKQRRQRAASHPSGRDEMVDLENHVAPRTSGSDSAVSTSVHHA